VGGEVIVEAGGVAIGHLAEIEHLVQRFGRAGEPMPVVVRRGGTDVPLEVLPVLGRDPSGRSMRYLIGAYLRDPAAGGGTLAFWDPVSGRYGALGHMVADGGRPADPSDGRTAAPRIQGIQAGARGRPGETVGVVAPGGPPSSPTGGSSPPGSRGSSPGRGAGRGRRSGCLKRATRWAPSTRIRRWASSASC